MNAEQYRNLVNKLEALQEAPTEPEQSAMNVASANFQPADASAAPAAAPAPAADPNQIPTIEAPTFSQAYAKARAQKLKKFKWCGIYAVKDPVNPQPVVTKPQNGTAINDRNANGSYVGQNGLDSQTPSYQPGA